MTSIDYLDSSIESLECFGLENLFLETILPLIIIIAHFTTIRGARAIVVNLNPTKVYKFIDRISFIFLDGILIYK